MMKVAIALCLAVAVAPALAISESNYNQLFDAWKAQHGKNYATPEEETMRLAIFKVNLDKVQAHNAKGLSWTMAMNEYADLTSTEFAIGRIGGYVPRSLRRERNEVSLDSAELPSSVDWTTKGAVTAVKNQGQCGSCWAFSTTGSTEGANAIAGKGLVSLSEQQLVDCSGSYGNQGCNGGLMDQAFQYIKATGGLCTESSYPYTAQDGTCKSSCKRVHTITGYTDVTRDSDSALAAAVAQQPVSVAVEADQSSFQLYSGGVMTGSCGTNLDHGVLVVGYGEDGQKYWKVKNSWGASWGEAGYIRLGRGSQYNGGAGQCGIYSDPSYPSA